MKKTKLGVLLALFSVALPTVLNVNLETVDMDEIGKHLYVKPFETMHDPYTYTDSITSEPKYSSQFHLKHINIGNTWDSYRGEGVTVAVIDSGINYQHVDFFDRNGNSIISDLSGVYDTSAGSSNYYVKSVRNNGGDYSILEDDEEGHGTNVAATIAAAVNDVGTAGIAPNVNLMFLKTSDYSLVSINYLLQYAISKGADIINMSFGAYVSDFTYEYNGSTYTEEGIGEVAATYFVNTFKKAHDAGIVLVAAAGNENTYEKSYPACNDYVIGVGALSRNSSTSIAAYSNHGENVDIVAPGSVYVAGVGSTTSYTETQGTSFASPVTAACLALLKSKYPDMSGERMEQRLLDTAYDIGTTGTDEIFGRGRVDVSRLLTIPVTGVSLSKENLVMKQGDTYQLQATIEPSDADNQNYLFVSNNDAVATIDENTGLVTAVGIGETEVGVLTEDGGYEAYCTVVVTSDGVVPLTDISLNKSSLSLRVGNSETLVPTVTPSYATNADFTWSTSSASVATVDNGVVTGVSDGTATITVSAGGKSASCEVTVRDGKAKTITVSPDKKTINLNKEAQFYATVGPEDTDDKTVTWSSSDPSVATINSSTGVATSLKEGTTTIIATANDGSGVIGTAELTVSSKAITYSYKKVTEDLADYTGQFLFVYETKKEVFNGNLETLDAVGNTITGVTITDNTIESTTDLDKAAFTIAPMTGGYSIKSYLGKYIYGTSGSNKLNTGDTEQLNTISVATTGNVTVKSNTSVLTYNTSSGQNRFRYMKSNSGSIQLYKYTEDGVAPDPITVTGLSKTGTLTKTNYNVGDTFDPSGLTILAEKSDGSSEDVTSSVVWTPSVMTLGTTSVTGTYTIDGTDYTIVVDGITVAALPDVDLVSIAFEQTSKEMKVGDSETVTVTYEPSNATNKSLSFASSNTNVATINENGLLVAKAKGKTRITATSLSNSSITTSMIVTVKEEASSTQGTWTRVTNASTLSAGDKLVMVCEGQNKIATDISSQIMGNVDVTIESNYTIASLPDTAIVLTLGGSAGSWTLANESGQLLGATAVKKLAWGSGTTTWSISISSNKATIQNGTSSYGKFMYNTSSPRFTTYTSSASSTMILPNLYRLEGGEQTDLEKLIDTITYADTCNDYTNANDYWNAYSALSDEDKETFKSSTMEDVDGSTNLYDKLVYMKTLKDQSTNEGTNNITFNMNNKPQFVLFVSLIGAGFVCTVLYYFYKKRNYDIR